MTDNIEKSRAKDYTNPFRKITFENDDEMTSVVGTLEDNSFIKHQQEELKQFKAEIETLKKMFVKTAVTA